MGLYHMHTMVLIDMFATPIAYLPYKDWYNDFTIPIPTIRACNPDSSYTLKRHKTIAVAVVRAMVEKVAKRAVATWWE